jgi:probable HAF family extracellular repeat protein
MRLAALVWILTIGALAGTAQTLTCTFQFTGSGTLGAQAFTNAAVTITTVANTTNISGSLAAGSTSLTNASASILVAGVGGYYFTVPTSISVEVAPAGASPGRSVAEDISFSSFGTPLVVVTTVTTTPWNMLSALGQLITPNGELDQWNNNAITTSGGTVNLYSTSGSIPVTVQAALTSAPVYTPIAYPGASETAAYAINDAGQIVGQYTIGTGYPQGFLFSGGEFTSIDYPGAWETSAYGINNAGVIIGSYDVGSPTGTSTVHGFVYQNGAFTTIDFPAAANSWLSGINNDGVMSGVYEPTGLSLGPGLNALQYGFIYTLNGGTFTEIQYPGGISTYAGAINDNGQIVGTYTYDTNGNFEGFLKTGSAYTTVSIASNVTSPLGINNAGQEVGFYFNGSYPVGFLLIGTTFTVLAIPGATTTPTSINNQGQVVGQFFVGETEYGFLMNPANSGGSACDAYGTGSVTVADVQLIVNEALGVAPSINDLNGDGVVNILDVQIEINAALGLGCA